MGFCGEIVKQEEENGEKNREKINFVRNDDVFTFDSSILPGTAGARRSAPVLTFTVLE